MNNLGFNGLPVFQAELYARLYLMKALTTRGPWIQVQHSAKGSYALHA
ncbi:MAG: hypothetical protein ACI80V_002316 [Rhodothermales bacterium]